ncbi:hypothetical protein PHISCL_09449 [Aspergillus sclerotialis]|uniref:Uncharacterized protein n=1 Tax=Aspergillus sclerotialis TaxID=2070753 RepID=A0A3A2Z550_9EURO|nr:hypothetical protein PHISCL_09449 [Aspergillus sclerotialis]
MEVDVEKWDIETVDTVAAGIAKKDNVEDTPQMSMSMIGGKSQPYRWCNIRYIVLSHVRYPKMISYLASFHLTEAAQTVPMKRHGVLHWA